MNQYLLTYAALVQVQKNIDSLNSISINKKNGKDNKNSK